VRVELRHDAAQAARRRRISNAPLCERSCDFRLILETSSCCTEWRECPTRRLATNSAWNEKRCWPIWRMPWSRSAARRGPPIPDMVASTDLRSGCRVWARLGVRLSLRAVVRCVPERKNGLCGMRRVRLIMAACRLHRIMNTRHPPGRAVRGSPSATTCLGISPSPMKKSGSSTHGSAICWTSFGDWIPDWRTSWPKR